LNNALTKISNFGNRNIKSYSEFVSFFNEVKAFLGMTSCDDIICNDFGEVKLAFKNKFYSVIIGTGYDNVFSVLQFLQCLSNLLGTDELVENSLIYVDNIINQLAEYNVSPYKEPRGVYEIPSEKFFMSVNNLFLTNFYSSINPELVNIFSNTEIIKKKHFIIHNNASYPLFNSSLLVDLYSYLLKRATKKQVRDHVEYTIIKKLYNVCDSKSIYVDYTVIDNNKPVSKQPITFIVHVKNAVIIAINKDAYSEDDLIIELKRIETLHKEGSLIIASMLKETNEGIKIPAESDIQIILYGEYTDITSEIAISVHENNHFQCFALDLITMLCFSENMCEMSQFMSYYLRRKEGIICSSISNIFFEWQDSDKEFFQGANKIDLVGFVDDAANNGILKYFKTELAQYPFHIQDSMFTEPFSWVVKPVGNHKRYISKCESGVVGIALSLSNGAFIFLVNNINLYDIKTAYDVEKIDCVERLNYNLFSYYLQFFEKIDTIKNQIIQFLFLTFDYAKRVDNNGFTNNSLVKYVLSDMHPDISNHTIIRYTANLESLIDDMCGAADKSVENKYFLELLSPLLQKYTIDFYELQEKIKQDFNSEKTYNIKWLPVNFYVSQQICGEIELNIEFLVAVRKRIAEICKIFDIKPGKFKNKQATDIVRKIQKTIFKEFEEELSKYEMSDLHMKALCFYSVAAIEIFKNNRMDNPPEYLNDSRESGYKNIDYKAEQKRRSVPGDLIYLMETNLSLNRVNTVTNTKCNQEKFDYLLCFAHWLSELQSTSAFCYYNESDYFIEVTSDYCVNTGSSLEDKKFLEEFYQRSISNAIYPIKNDENDENFIKEVKQAFFQDTGIEFEEMYNMIERLMLELPIEYTKNGYEITSNVFSVERKKLVDDVVNLSGLNIDKIDKILNFLCISTDKIRQIEGENVEILPVWEREKRDNRFQMKPILEIDGNIIFSPVTLYNLLNIWISAFVEFYLPYEINLTNLRKAVDKWKKRYEKQIVIDVFNIFKNKQFQYVEKEVDLHSRDRIGNHPSDLGDYDVIAVDSKNKDIYVIECKFLQKVGSIFKASMEQQRFFFKKKYDEKFQRRIDYIEKNYEKFFISQNLTVDSSYKIKPFMITNKLFASFFKKNNFQILSFDEFKKFMTKIV
jgi:hypothetical protein